MARGRRRCALRLSFGLHVLGWVTLLAGCLTPYWARVENSATGEVITYRGLYISCDADGDCSVVNFNDYSDASSNKTSLYGALAVAFGVICIVTDFFLVQTYCFALCNKSCGEKYYPEALLIFSLITGFLVVTCLVMFELQMGRTLSDSTEIKMDYSRGFVILATALIFLGSFVTIWDRRPPGANKQKISSFF